MVSLASTNIFTQNQTWQSSHLHFSFFYHFVYILCHHSSVPIWMVWLCWQSYSIIWKTLVWTILINIPELCKCYIQVCRGVLSSQLCNLYITLQIYSEIRVKTIFAQILHQFNVEVFYLNSIKQKFYFFVLIDQSETYLTVTRLVFPFKRNYKS